MADASAQARFEPAPKAVHAREPVPQQRQGPDTPFAGVLGLQRKSGNRSVGSLVAADKDEGVPLDTATRSRMESHFGHDFRRVRVHPGANLAQEQADAAAVGQDLYFAAGELETGSERGRRLLAHELTHVVQQSGSRAVSGLSNTSLEAEANTAAEDIELGRKPIVRGRASAGRPQFQPKGSTGTKIQWKSGDVILNAEAVKDVKVRGGLVSGQDQAHLNVSTLGRLAYDPAHTSPEDPFRWNKLTEIIDSGHVRINAVGSGDKFSVLQAAGSNATVVLRSIDEIKVIVGDLSVIGITLTQRSTTQAIADKEAAAAAPAAASGGGTGGTGSSAPVTAPPVTGAFSNDAKYDEIYYDKSAPNALAHELYGHYWLSLKGVPFTHPAAGATGLTKAMGELSGRHGITDPFGDVFSGTVREYIDTFIESKKFEEHKLPSGATVKVPVSPTQGAGRAEFTQAFKDFLVEAKTGLTGTTFTAKLAQALRRMANNYDLVRSKSDRDLIIDFLEKKWFDTKLSKPQQELLRFMLQEFQTRKGWSNPLAGDLQSRVGLPASSQMFTSPLGSGPGGLQLSNP